MLVIPVAQAVLLGAIMEVLRLYLGAMRHAGVNSPQGCSQGSWLPGWLKAGWLAGWLVGWLVISSPHPAETT